MKPSELLEVYSVSIDEIPDLVTRDGIHEICDPGPLTAKEIVRMWTTLKMAHGQLREALDEIRIGIANNRDSREEILARAQKALEWKAPQITAFACSAPRCTKGEHKMDGPVVQRENMGSVSCSKCGALAFDVDTFMGGA